MGQESTGQSGSWDGGGPTWPEHPLAGSTAFEGFFVCLSDMPMPGGNKQCLVSGY